MKSLTLSRVATIVLPSALMLMLSLAVEASAQTDASGTRFPLLQGPALQSPAELEGAINRPQTAPPMFDALGNLVDNPNAKTFESRNFSQSNFDPIPEPNGPQLPETTYAQPPAQEYAIPQNIDPREQRVQPPAVVERARPLPPREDFYQSPDAFPPAGLDGRRAYSRADIERALQRLAIMEELLRQQLRRETAFRYSSGSRYPSDSYGARYPNRQRCGNSPRGGYSSSYGPAAGY